MAGRAVQYHFTEAEDATVQQNLAEWIVALVTQVLVAIVSTLTLRKPGCGIQGSCCASSTIVPPFNSKTFHLGI